MNDEPGAAVLIVHPDLQPARQRLLFRLLATLGWALWLYMMLPLLALGGWLIGAGLAHSELLLDDAQGFGDLLAPYALIIPAATLLIIAWSEYRLQRYRRVYANRRHSVAIVTPEMLCARFRIDRATLDQLNTGRILTLDVDDQEMLRDVRFGPGAAPADPRG